MQQPYTCIFTVHEWSANFRYINHCNVIFCTSCHQNVHKIFPTSLITNKMINHVIRYGCRFQCSVHKYSFKNIGKINQNIRIIIRLVFINKSADGNNYKLL